MKTVKRIRRISIKMARLALSSVLVFLMTLLSFSPAIQAPQAVQAAGSFTVDSQLDFSNGTQDGNLVLGDQTRLDTTTPGYTEDEESEFTEDGYLDWESDVVSNQIQIANTGITEYYQNSNPGISHIPSGNDPFGGKPYYDSVNEIIYYPTFGSGVFSVDTQGTIEQSDDVVIANYTSGTVTGVSAQILGDYPSVIQADGNYLYIESDGVSVIDTQGTFDDASDDTLVAEYTTGSTPAISNNIVFDIHRDSANNLLYVAGFGGVDIINDNGTPGIPGDDTLAGSINPGFSVNVTVEGDFMYLGVSGGGLQAYNRNGAPGTPAGYTLEATYTNVSTPGILSPTPQSAKVYGNYLIVETFTGITAIDLGVDTVPGGGDDSHAADYVDGTVLPAGAGNTPAMDVKFGSLYIGTENNGIYTISFGADTVPGGGDDLIVQNISGVTQPGLHSPYISDISIADNGWHVYSSGSRAGLINPYSSFAEFKSSGTFISSPLPLSTTPSGVIEWEELATGDHTVNVFTRTGDSSVFYSDDFDDSVLPTITSNGFDSVTESGSFMTFLDNSTGCFGFCDADWEVDPTANAFSGNSLIKMRLRYTSASGTDEMNFRIRTDGGETNSEETTLSSGAWTTVSYTPGQGYNEVGFTTTTNEGGNVGDTLEIDLLEVIFFDATWGPWSSGYTNPAGEIITSDTESGQQYIQYRIDMETLDSVTSPTIDSVTLSDFQSTGQYTSQVFDAGSVSDWTELTSSSTLPNDTSISFFTRTGDAPVPDGSWSSWEAVNSPIASPDARYLQFRADFATAEPASSPQLDSVTVNYVASSSPVPDDSQSTIVASPDHITANGVSTSTITVTLRDALSTLIPGQAVVMNTDAGTISSVTDNGDGTYTATLTSSAVAEVATVSFTVNATPFSATTAVEFLAGSSDTATVSPATTVSETDLSIMITPDAGGSSSITKIHYTLDGSEVSESSALYDGPISLSKKGTTILKWKGYNDTSDPLDSGTEYYYLPNTNITPICHYPDNGQCFGPQTFTFTTAESTETVYYTVDNTNPLTNEPIYTQPDESTEEFFAQAKPIGSGETVHIGENTKIRFASKNRFDQASPTYYRHSVLNFPHVLTMPDPGANAHLLGFRHDGLRAETPNFILEQFSKNGGSITTGDLNGDGRDEIIMSPGKGKTTDLYVFSYHETGDTSAEKELILLAFKKDIYGNENIRTGLSIAAADINGNGREEIISVPKEGAKAHVLVHEYRIDADPNGGPGAKYLRRTTDGDFLAYGFTGDYTEDYTRGAEVAAADLNGDGIVEIITSSDSGQIRIFDKRGNQTFSLGFHPYGKLTRRALKLATGDVTGDGIPEIITIPKKGNPHVLFVNRFGQRVFTPNFVPDINKGQEENEIATADMDFDLKPELIIQDKDLDGKPILRIFDPETQAAKPYMIKPNYPGYIGGLTIATGLWSGRE
jgi:hypothetical protein